MNLSSYRRGSFSGWVNELGIPWLSKDEFEIGCTIEHAGYSVSWLTAIFGTVKSVAAFSFIQIKDKELPFPLEYSAPDFSVASRTFPSGSVARLTCSFIAPSNHSIQIFGVEDVLSTDDIWKPKSKVYLWRSMKIGSRTILVPWKKTFQMAKPINPSLSMHVNVLLRSLSISTLKARARHLKKRVDFCLSIVELADSIRQKRICRLSGNYCLHTNEAVLAIHNAMATGSTYNIKTEFDPIDPMLWAKS